MASTREQAPSETALPEGAGAGSRPSQVADGLRVVGIASSAGGVEALRELVASLPYSDRLTFTVAHHVSAAHAGSLAKVLAAHTQLRVVDPQDGERLKPGTVYIVPPDRDTTFVDGAIRLVQPQPQSSVRPRPSADRLFQSIAACFGESAIGVVLSGTGADGTAGTREIKAVGGFTIAQDPATAQHDGMPRSAIRGGCVDLVLSPAEIGPALLRLVSRSAAEAAAAEAGADADLHAQIAQLVRVRTAFKLDDYKPGTVQRRVARRLGLLNLESVRDYVDYLRATPDEAQKLVRDIFIGVTSFFRDGDAFVALEAAVRARVRHAPMGVLRCWVPGCASGEEAYGIAMLLEDALHSEQRAELQYVVFASDLDDAALQVARGGAYSQHALEALPAALRERYVEMHGATGRVVKSIRSRMVFARQNVIDDPPFSRVDLISCRNLLIYLTQPVQRCVLERFHYALRPGGQLFLGRSESADAHDDLFAVDDAHARLYRRVEGRVSYSLPYRRMDERPGASRSGEVDRRIEADPDAISQRMLRHLVRQYAPPSLVVDRDNEVVYLQGGLKPFLEFPSGRAEMNLFDMVDAEIGANLRALIYRARRDRVATEGAGHVRMVDGVPHEVRIRVEALEDGDDGLLMLSFVTRSEPPVVPDAMPLEPREAAIIGELEQELAETRSHLSMVVEELETSNDELQSLNEALRAGNEELQSANEELQTSNEELQSANEELLTVNEELQVKSGELHATASMLTNVKQSLDFPLLVVDADRRVVDANQASGRLVHSALPMAGLSIRALSWRFALDGLEPAFQRVLDCGERTMLELAGDAGTRYRLHLMPFRSRQQSIDGVVMLFEDVTALSEAETAQRESEDRYRQVTESLPQLVWTCLADGPCDYLSPQWVRYTGVPEAEQLGYGWLDQLHPDDRPRAIEHWRRTAQLGRDYEIEFRIRRHDGAYRWFHTLARPLRNAEGAIVKWYGSNTDIDDRKRAEAELKMAAESLEQRVAERTAALERTSTELADTVHVLDDLYHNAPCGYHSLDVAGHIARINDTELRWLGYERSELIGRPLVDVLTPASRATFVANYPRILAGETLSNLEIDFVAKDGTELPTLVSATPVFDDEGRYLNSRSVVQNYMRQRKQQRMLRSILSAAPIAVRIARISDRRVTFANPAFAELVRCSPEQAIGLDIRQFHADPERFDAIQRRLAAGESVRNELLEICRPEDPDDRRWVLASFTTVDYEGTPAVLAWKFDVTELQRAKRAAEEASRTKSRFLANMSHEIRTPMNGVIGMIDLARRGLTDPVQVDRLEKASWSARQLLAILNDILDLSKIEAGHVRLKPAVVDLASCIEGTRVLYEQAAREKGMDLLVEVAAPLKGRTFLTDALRLRQVLDNLVANAIKFSARGQVRVVALLEAEGEGTVTVRFEVRDQGVGVAPEDQARIFKTFEQVDASSTRNHEGTGLGLAISSAIVTMMGGEMGLRSALGVGSTFWFRLPLVVALGGPMEAFSPAQASSVRGPSRHANVHVLLAEDHPINLEVELSILVDLGYHVDVAENGEQAVTAAARRRYDLIFMDVQMPVMNGLDATRAIRAGGPNRTTPIIAMTANAFEEDRRQCLEAGMDDFVAKPLPLETLPELASNWLDRSRSRAPEPEG